MARLNLTLDEDTFGSLTRHARRAGARRATVARELLREAMARREAVDRARRLAQDYSADRSDARELLTELEATQLELLDDEPS